MMNEFVTSSRGDSLVKPQEHAVPHSREVRISVRSTDFLVVLPYSLGSALHVLSGSRQMTVYSPRLLHALYNCLAWTVSGSLMFPLCGCVTF